MTKGMHGKHAELQITGRQNLKQLRGNYHGRTELGIGEHEKIKKRLEEERHRDYQDHMARKEMQRSAKNQWDNGDPNSLSDGSGSVCNIGYETSQSISQQRKQLNETRKAEYVAHLAAQSTSIQTDRHDGSNVCTQPAATKQNDESTNSLQVSPGGGVETSDERKQKQRNYAEALREQIAEKKRATDQNRKKEKENDKKNIEMAQGSNQSFNYGSYNHNNNSPQ